jgi:hypothetical protein
MKNKCSKSLGKCKSLRFHFTPVRMTTINKTNNSAGEDAEYVPSITVSNGKNRNAA